MERHLVLSTLPGPGMEYRALYPAEAPVFPTLNSQIGAEVPVDIFKSLPWLGADAKAQDRFTKAGATNFPGSSAA
eukprot:3364906-Pyramimonas_sp.AAC.1